MEKLYQISNITQQYVNKKVLDITHLDIRQGEILGLIGSNGSGKSTLLRHIAFLENPKSGKLLYKNFSFLDIPLHVKREISILLPEPYLLKRSVKDNLLFGLQIRKDKENIDKKIDEVMNLVGLNPKKFLHRQWFELSSGETQRLALASRLILKPKVLLLDEPTNSLDFNGIPQFFNAVKYANENWGTTFVIASHDMPFINSLATKKIRLHFGKLIDFSTANFLCEKWEKKSDCQVYTFLDSQKIVLSNKRDVCDKKGVAINPKSIGITLDKNHKGQNMLHATIKSISHSSKSDEISVLVDVGSQTIEIIKNIDDFMKNKLYPAQNIFIYFDEDAIQEL